MIITRSVDVRGLFNPVDCRSLGVIRTELASMRRGQILEVKANKFQLYEVQAWTRKFSHAIVNVIDEEGLVTIYIEKEGKREESDTPNAISAEQLKQMLDSRRQLFILDVRSAGEFEQWRIEVRYQIDTLHIPYPEFVENPEACISRVPRGPDIAVVCANGGTSGYVAELLRGRGFRAKNLEGGMVAWGNLHQAVPVSMAVAEQAGMAFYQVNRFAKGCLSYVIGSEGEAIVVDPSRNINEYLKLVEEKGLKIKHVIDTHLHADHISGGPRLAERAGAKYHIQSADAADALYSYEPIDDGQEFRAGGVKARVIAMQTPGHTLGSTTLLVNEKCLLAGDTLFVKGTGRPDLGHMAEPWARVLYRTLFLKLKDLPDDVWVLPAHYSLLDEMREDGLVAAELGELRKNNPAMRSRSEDEFVRFILANISEQPAVYQEIRKANLGLIQVDEEKSTEMELGKNQCAALEKLGARS